MQKFFYSLQKVITRKITRFNEFYTGEQFVIEFIIRQKEYLKPQNEGMNYICTTPGLCNAFLLLFVLIFFLTVFLNLCNRI